MKALTRTLVTGSLAVALTVCVAGTSHAQFGFFGPFGFHHHHHHGWHPRPYYSSVVYSPVVVESTPTYVQSNDTNPVPIVSIQLVNPVENGVALTYRLDDGVAQSLSPGSSVTISQVAVISFDRGGGVARARYQLTDGTYKFVVSGGLWELVHSATPYQQATAYSAQQGSAYSGQQAAASTNVQPAAYSGQQAAANSGQQAAAYSSGSATPAAN